MKWAVFKSVVGFITLSGCSYLKSVGNSFGQDEKNAAAELSTKTAKVAAENSDSPEAAVTNLAVNEGTSHIGASIVSRLTNETSRTKVSVTSQQSQDTALERRDSTDVASNECAGVTRLVGVINLTTPFTITSNTTKMQFNFIITNYGVEFYVKGSGAVTSMGSGAFSGSFVIE